MYQNFSFTEACVSEMKTTALCVFALFLSSMLVDGIIYIIVPALHVVLAMETKYMNK